MLQSRNSPQAEIVDRAPSLVSVFHGSLCAALRLLSENHYIFDLFVVVVSGRKVDLVPITLAWPEVDAITVNL